MNNHWINFLAKNIFFSLLIDNKYTVIMYLPHNYPKL